MSGPLYIYGLLEAASHSALPPGTLPAGIGGAPVRPYALGGLVALVSDCPGLSVQRARRNILAHTNVLEAAHAHADVLPLRFGTVAPHEGAARACMAANRGDFLEALRGLAGRVELGLRAVWRDGGLIAALAERDPALRAMRDRLRGRSAGETYYDRIDLGRSVETGLAAFRAAETERVTALCRQLAERSTDLPLQEENTLFSHAYLLPRAREAEFDAAVQDIVTRHGARLSLHYVGPMPAFNFITLQARWSGSDSAAA